MNKKIMFIVIIFVIGIIFILLKNYNPIVVMYKQIVEHRQQVKIQKYYDDQRQTVSLMISLYQTKLTGLEGLKDSYSFQLKYLNAIISTNQGTEVQIKERDETREEYEKIEEEIVSTNFEIERYRLMMKAIDYHQTIDEIKLVKGDKNGYFKFTIDTLIHTPK